MVEATSFFSSEATANCIKSYWWIFPIVGILIVMVRLIPDRRFIYKLDNKDISIELVSGDIFKQKGPIIVESNTDFVTNTDIISESSIQGIFTRKYFSNHQAVKDIIKGQITEDRQDYGTTVTVRSNDRIGYFCAIADVNENGVAHSNIENIRVSLAKL